MRENNTNNCNDLDRYQQALQSNDLGTAASILAEYIGCKAETMVNLWLSIGAGETPKRGFGKASIPNALEKMRSAQNGRSRYSS